jgi:uncharacterized protein (DUF58 family)
MKRFSSSVLITLRRLRGPFVVRRYTRPNRITTIELRQRLPVIAFVMVLLWHVAAPSEVTAMGLAALGGLLVAAYLWARAMARHVSGTRQLRYAAAQVGDELEERLTLHNASGLPVLWAEIVDRSNLPGYAVASVRATDAHSTVQWRAHAICTRRGLFTLGPWELRTGDPFGIFHVRQIYTQPQSLLVYPPLAALPDDLLPHRAAVGDHRPLRQPLPAETINAISTRPYSPGDPLRRVHWRTTARRDAPYAKLFEPEATSSIWLILDFGAAGHLDSNVIARREAPKQSQQEMASPPAGARNDVGRGSSHSSGEQSRRNSAQGAHPESEEPLASTEETMVLIAASLASQLLRARLAVGLLARTETLHAVLPRRGQPHLWQILRTLAPLHPPAQSQSLAQTLAQAQSLISVRDLVVVITASLDPEWPRALSRLARPRGGAEAILIDPASFGGMGHAEAHAPLLAEMGIPAKIVRRGDVRPIPGAYGTLRRWEFMTLGTGRAVARQTPRVAAAQALPVEGER